MQINASAFLTEMQPKKDSKMIQINGLEFRYIYVEKRKSVYFFFSPFQSEVNERNTLF